jgi:hypothetical protein
MKTLFSLHRGLTILVLLFFLGYNSNNCYAQETVATNNYYQLEEETMGIYQIQMIGVRTKPSISNDLLELVLSNQQQSVRSTFLYRDHIRIEVLSKDEVASGIKFSAEELITYVNED